MGAALAARKRFAGAEPYLIGGYEGLKHSEARLSAQARRELDAAAGRIVPFYEAWGKKDKASEWKKKLGQG